MSTTTHPKELLQENVDQPSTHDAGKNANDSEDKIAIGRRPKKKSLLAKMNSKAMMWTRRIHLFSGLFMLPWVLLYGFTAMLFNHSTWFSDSHIESVSLNSEQLNRLPISKEVAKQVVASLAADGIDIQLVDSPNAEFTRSAVASYENDETSTSLVIDLNSGTAYKRIRKKPDANKANEKEADGGSPKPKSLAKGIAIDVDPGDVLDATDLVSAISGEEPTKPVKLQSIPTLEFDAIVNGEFKRLRFSQKRRRGGQDAATGEQKEVVKPEMVKGTVTSIGDNPRDLSWRSYFLRLHLAHGYPVTKNARYWWAYAVDAMFLCMVFWGFSGVFMWWQIKRTRMIGFALLFCSFVTAAYLAYAMHWQLANG